MKPMHFVILFHWISYCLPVIFYSQYLYLHLQSVTMTVSQTHQNILEISCKLADIECLCFDINRWQHFDLFAREWEQLDQKC